MILISRFSLLLCITQNFDNMKLKRHYGKNLRICNQRSALLFSVPNVSIQNSSISRCLLVSLILFSVPTFLHIPFGKLPFYKPTRVKIQKANLPFKLWHPILNIYNLQVKSTFRHFYMQTGHLKWNNERNDLGNWTNEKFQNGELLWHEDISSCSLLSLLRALPHLAFLAHVQFVWMLFYYGISSHM